METKFTGILKIKMEKQEVPNNVLEADAVFLKEKNLHVTLVHQSILKPFKKVLKKLSKDNLFPTPPSVVFEDKASIRTDTELERKSWVFFVKNQQDLKDYVDKVMDAIGGKKNPEPERKFHVSVANLTGNPGDSVK